MAINVIKMELKEDGETVVLHTMLWEGTPRKHVVKVRDIQPHSNPSDLFHILEGGGTMFDDHIPVLINGDSYLFHQHGFHSCGDRQIVKAILNGYPIDTRNTQQAFSQQEHLLI